MKRVSALTIQWAAAGLALLLMIGAATLLAHPLASQRAAPQHEDEANAPLEVINDAGPGSRAASAAKASASALSPAAAVPTAFHNIRVEENWPQQSGSSLKYIPINRSGSAYLSLGGQVRVRSEFWDDFFFSNAPGRDDSFGLFRLRLHGDLYLGSHVRFFVEGKSALSSGRDLPGGNRPIDVDHVDLLNALVDIKAPAGDGSFTFRLGRQEIQLGKQRLISPLDWANTRRSFDAARSILKMGGWRLDTFFGRLVQVRKYDFNSYNNSGNDLFGAYLSGNLGKSGLNADFYWLGLDRDRSTRQGVSGSENRHSLGARLGGRIGESRFDFDVEGTYQFGDHADRDIRAEMFSAIVGYSLPEHSWNPRFFLGFDYASGDDDPNDGSTETFDQLFPLAHAYLGFADVTSRQNNVDLHGGVTFKPIKRFGVRMDIHQLWRANENDALYNAGGSAVLSGGPGTPKEIGTEIDLTVTFKPKAGWLVSAGYSRVFAGDFVKASTPGQDINFVHLGVQYTS